MGIMDGFKARKALMTQQKGNTEEAKKMYDELFAGGYLSAAYMLPYSVLLLREGGEANYLKVKEILKKAEKAPDLDAGRKQQLFMNYAVAQYKLGEIEKAIQLLEASHRKAPCGLTYQSLGWLYIEAGDAEKALAYNQEALDYDDEDPIVLDNLGQTYYHLLNDKEKAKEYFDKAIEIKDSQIDTLYFLAQYDKEAGDKQAAKEKLEKALEGRFSPLNYATKEMIEKEIEELKK
ncbi:MAG: tetratricopeptide repeat protein [Clostridia bacterium]|nr:tetratricopeptide repeat protein [Clostridia bacterium]